MRKPPPGDSGDTGTGHALDYLSPEYALFEAGTLSPQEAATAANSSGSIDNCRNMGYPVGGATASR